MKFRSILVHIFALAILATGCSHAENGCPPGMIPASGTNINSCTAIPPGYYPKQEVPNAQSPLWESRWLAIATDSIRGVIGVATDMVSQSIAEQSALSSCEEKGGNNCKISAALANGCAAMTAGDSGFNVQTRSTLNKAESDGMKICTASTSNCYVYYSGCSLPVRIR